MNKIMAETVPFAYGKIASFGNFTNREEETQTLMQQWRALSNIVLISPRRWGKTSLIQHSSAEFERLNPDYKVVHLDMFGIRSEQEFYQVFASKVLKISYSKVETISKKVADLFKQVIPKISFNPIPESEFSLSFDWESLKLDPSEVLDLPEKIAQKEGFKIIICIDEFQNIHFFEDQMVFQKKLRAHWQQHQQVAYTLYGSKENMMQTLFNDKKMPFYRFAYLLNMGKIKLEKWQTFIIDRFKTTGKSISAEEAADIASRVELLPHYVQQLAQIVWFNTQKKCHMGIIASSFDNLQGQLGTYFIRETEQISFLQLAVLQQLIDTSTINTKLETIEKYKLKSSAHVIKAKKALFDKQIIRMQNKDIEFVDPMYGSWLRDIYFAKR
jgi:uncharacterized protein